MKATLKSKGKVPNKRLFDALQAASDAMEQAKDEFPLVDLDESGAATLGGLRGPCFKYDHGGYRVYCCYIDGEWHCAKHAY